MKAKSKYLLWVAIGIGGLLWAVYVWPTPWNHYKQGSNNLRVNRFTGKTQVLEVYGWQDTKAPSNVKARIIHIDIDKLQDAFPSLSPDLQGSLEKIRVSIRYRLFNHTLVELNKLAQIPDLTDPQKKAVDDVIEQVKQAISTAAVEPPQ